MITTQRLADWRFGWETIQQWHGAVHSSGTGAGLVSELSLGAESLLQGAMVQPLVSFPSVEQLQHWCQPIII
jgi:hypothetical protein